MTNGGAEHMFVSMVDKGNEKGGDVDVNRYNIYIIGIKHCSY